MQCAGHYGANQYRIDVADEEKKNDAPRLLGQMPLRYHPMERQPDEAAQKHGNGHEKACR